MLLFDCAVLHIIHNVDQRRIFLQKKVNKGS